VSCCAAFCTITGVLYDHGAADPLEEALHGALRVSVRAVVADDHSQRRLAAGEAPGTEERMGRDPRNLVAVGVVERLRWAHLHAADVEHEMPLGIEMGTQLGGDVTDGMDRYGDRNQRAPLGEGFERRCAQVRRHGRGWIEDHDVVLGVAGENRERTSELSVADNSQGCPREARCLGHR